MFAVTADEDELWSSLPDPDLVEQDERLHYLHNKLACVHDHIADLNSEGPQLEFVSTVRPLYVCSLHWLYVQVQHQKY